MSGVLGQRPTRRSAVARPAGSRTREPLHAALALGGSGYSATYDQAGNMACRAGNSSTTCTGSSPTGAVLSWDAEERLTAWQNTPTSPTTTAAFLSDGEGNRVEQQVTTNGTTTTFTYVGNLEKVATSGGTTTTTTYYYAASQLIALATNGVFSYLGADGLGSVDLALSSSGSVTASRLYGTYGGLRYTAGSWPSAKGFTGQFADGPTSLDSFGSRYYDPSANQFVSADSVLPGNGYDVWGLSRYAYVAGNPTSRTDPTGHDWWNAVVHTVSSVAAAVAPVASAVLDATTGIPSMINDVHTIFFDPKASTLDKVLAGGDLLLNVAMDASMLVGVGEGLRLAVAGAKVAAHLGEDVGMHALEHAGEDALEHVGEHEVEDVAEHVGEHAAEDGGEHAAEGGSCTTGLSFAASTLVATPRGEQPIAALKVGAAVLAYDPKTGTASTQTVQATYINHDTDLVDVTLRVRDRPAATAGQQAQRVGAHAAPAAGAGGLKTHDEVVHTTANHPWYTADHGWQLASFLHLGEPVARVDGRTATVVAIHAVPGAASMWDLTVSQVHTFAVGAGQYVVHNTEGCGGAGGETPKYSRDEYGKPTADQAAAAKGKTDVCPYCGERDPDTVEHIGSQKSDWVNGGYNDSRAARSARVNDPDNLIGACRSCNSSKGARPLGTGPGEWWPRAWPEGVWWPFGGP
jgi:RHS repeat-associated protein